MYPSTGPGQVWGTPPDPRQRGGRPSVLPYFSTLLDWTDDRKVRAMAVSDEPTITGEVLKLLARRAGLDLSPQELERLWPLYQQLMAQISLLHDPSLPLEEPAVIFPATWFPR